MIVFLTINLRSSGQEMQGEPRLHLTSVSLRSVPFGSHPGSFTFISNQGQYVCSPFAAELLSPKICHLRQFDATFSEYYLETCDTYGFFESFLKLASGEDLVIDRLHVPFYLSLCRELENFDLLSQLELYSGYPELTLDNVLDVLKLKLNENSAMIDREVGFIARNFHSIPDEELATLSPDTLSQILSREDLMLTSEDSLYHFVFSLIERDVRSTGLLEFVRLEFLSQEAIQHFVAASSANVHDWLNYGIWKRVCDRLLCPVTTSHLEKFKNRFIWHCNQEENNEEDQGTTFVLQREQPLNGIIAYLTDTSGGNVVDRDVINVIAQPKDSSQLRAPRNLFDLMGNNYFKSRDQPGQFFTIDFKDMRVSPTAYTIRSSNDGPGAGHPMSWVVEVSNDGWTWVEIDRRENCNDLNDKLVTRSFETRTGEQARMVRFRLTGPNHNGHDYILMRAFELFGSLTAN